MTWQESTEVFARRFDSSGAALDANEFQVNTFTTGLQQDPAIGVSAAGDFVVSWTSYGQDGDGDGVFARRFKSSGGALDANEFQVNSFTTDLQRYSSVSVSDSGNFIVAWTGYGAQDGSLSGIFAKRFESNGSPIDSGDLQINTFTNGSQYLPSVGVSPFGDFIVAWQDGSGQDVLAQRGCFETDGDGICDAEDILVTAPLSAGMVDCRTPGQRSTRPLIKWERGNYDRFRAMISWNPSFPKRRRITSGDVLLRRSKWKPGARAWRRVCGKESGVVYIRIFGVDRNVGKRNPRRKTLSNVVAPTVMN